MTKEQQTTIELSRASYAIQKAFETQVIGIDLEPDRDIADLLREMISELAEIVHTRIRMGKDPHAAYIDSCGIKVIYWNWSRDGDTPQIEVLLPVLTIEARKDDE